MWTDEPHALDAEALQQLANLTPAHVGHAEQLSRLRGCNELRDGDRFGHRNRATALSAVGCGRGKWGETAIRKPGPALTRWHNREHLSNRSPNEGSLDLNQGPPGYEPDALPG